MISRDGRSRQRLVDELEQLVRLAPVGLCLVDRSLRFRRVNEQLALLDGRPVEAHLGHTVREVVPELADAMEAQVRRVLETGQPILDLEISGAHPWEPDVLHTFLVSDHPLLSPRGEVDGVVSVVHDITPQKRAARRWRDMRDRLDEAQRLAALASWEWNLETGEVWWSRQMYRLCAQERGRFEPGLESMVELMHPDDRGELRAQLEALLAEPAIHVGRFRLLRDGEERVIESTATLERTPGGQPTRVVCAAQDVTAHARREAELTRERDELRARLAERERDLEGLRARLHRAEGTRGRSGSRAPGRLPAAPRGRRDEVPGA